MTDDLDRVLHHHQNLIRGAIAVQRQRGREESNRATASRTSLRTVLLNIRRKLPIETRPAFFEWFGKLVGGMGPELYASLGRDLTNALAEDDPLALANELDWLRHRLRPHVDDLKWFCARARAMEQAFWQDDQVAVEQALHSIRERCGPSMWLLSAEIAFKQQFEGLDAQKEIRNAIIKRYSGGLPAYLGFFLSIRNEERSTFSLFAEDYRNRLSSSRVKPALRAYLEYKILGSLSATDQSISSVLQFEQGQSSYDIYETVIDLLQRAVARGATQAWSDKAVVLLRSLDGVADWRIQKLLLVFTGHIEEGADSISVSPDESRQVGQHPMRAFWSLVSGSIEPKALEDAARSPGELRICRQMVSLLVRDLDFEENYGRLLKFSRNLSFLPGAKSIGALVDFMTMAVPVRDRPYAYASLNDRGAHVMDLIYIDPDLPHQTRLFLSEWFPEQEISDWSACANPQRPAALHPFPWYLSALRESSGDAFSALDTLAAIPCNSLSHTQRLLAGNLRIRSLLDAGEWRSSVASMSEEIARFPPVLAIMPARQALEDRDWNALATISDKLDLAIGLYALWKTTDESVHATYLRFAFEEVLFQFGVEMPSNLNKEAVEADSRIQFFLKNVCVPSLMDSSGFFTSSAELLDERARVLKLLMDTDISGRAVYEGEASAIQASRLIKSGLQIVDSNRVTVDAAALTRWAQRKYRESYSRYQALRGEVSVTAAAFEEMLDQITAATEMKGEYFSIPTSEADTLLLEIILALKENFLKDPQYGLEYFLGKRIRHGTIAGHMRGAAEAAYLITERSAPGTPYETNDFWLERLANSGPIDLQRASDSFDRFSERYDSLISEVRDRFLHVRSSTHPDGLFDIIVTAPQYHLLKAVSTPDVDFNQFVSVCIQTFWSLLGPSLTYAKQFLSGRVKQDVIRIFAELQAELGASVASEECCRSVSIAIQDVSTDVQRELDVVAGWFERVESRAVHQFSLQQAIEVAVHSALNSLTTFRPQITKNIEGGIATTQSVLLVAWEFVFNVLDNVYRRAKVGTEPSVRLDCLLDEANRRLLLVIVNPVGDEVDVADVQSRLATTREKIAVGDIVGGAAADKGSGLLKMASVAREFNSGSFSFSLDEEKREFTTTMELPVYVTQDAFSLTLPETTQG